VASADIIALANSMYGNHRLSATDAHTIQCPSGDVTLVPVPKGQGRYAGLLSVDLPSGRRGSSYTIAVRQLTQVSSSFRAPPPPIEIVERRTPAIVVPPKPFSWRQAQGAFQYTITVKPAGELLYPQERLLAWLKWRIGVTPPASRWRPVLGRYLSLTESLVTTLGGDPSKIPPSQTGTVPGKGSSHPPHGEHEITGKVVAIDYDRFGDFCGFTILSEHGQEALPCPRAPDRGGDVPRVEGAKRHHRGRRGTRSPSAREADLATATLTRLQRTPARALSRCDAAGARSGSTPANHENRSTSDRQSVRADRAGRIVAQRHPPADRSLQ
jgi:hypothetical protein